jgi:hypothetical protein
MSRSRSTSRSRIVKLSNTVPGGEMLDPYALLDDILKHFNSTDVPLVVKLEDGINTVSTSLQSFLQRDHEIVDGYIKIGFRKIAVKGLSASISYQIEVKDDITEEEEKEIDECVDDVIKAITEDLPNRTDHSHE